MKTLLTKRLGIDIIKDRRALLRRSTHLLINEKPLTVREPSGRSTRFFGDFMVLTSAACSDIIKDRRALLPAVNSPC